MSAGLPEQTMTAIRNRVKRLHRRQLVLLAENEGDTVRLWLVRHLTNEKLVELGTVDGFDQLKRLAAAANEAVDMFYAMKEDGQL